jgi:tetratricopeptide (TPR) repeat protein
MPYSRSVLRTLMAISVAAVAPLTQLAAERPAAAQTSKPPGKPKLDKKKQANEYVEQGLAAQQKGEYDGALALYGKAYELVPHPVLLFNMAQAHRLAGRPGLARDLYRQYLDAEPKGAKAKTAREFLVAMEAQIAAQAAAAKPEPTPPPTPTPTPAAPPPASEPGPDLKLDASAAATSNQRSAARASKLRLAGYITGGVGVASLGVGVAFHLRARSLSDDLSEPGVTFDPDKESSGKTSETLAYIGYAAGGALVISGAALYFFGRRAERERLAILPSLTPGSVGLVVSGGLP